MFRSVVGVFSHTFTGTSECVSVIQFFLYFRHPFFVLSLSRARAPTHTYARTHVHAHTFFFYPSCHIWKRATSSSTEATPSSPTPTAEPATWLKKASSLSARVRSVCSVGREAGSFDICFVFAWFFLLLFFVFVFVCLFVCFVFDGRATNPHAAWPTPVWSLCLLFAYLRACTSLFRACLLARSLAYVRMHARMHAFIVGDTYAYVYVQETRNQQTRTHAA